MFSRNVFGDQADAQPAYDNVASAVFTSPQIATCGLTEEEAVAQHGDLSIFTSIYRRARRSCPISSGSTLHSCASGGSNNRRHPHALTQAIFLNARPPSQLLLGLLIQLLRGPHLRTTP